MMMHAALDENDTDYAHLYFSEIHQVIRDTPANLFDPSFDTNDPDPVS